MRLLAGLLILILIGCAVMASQSHKPFETRIDAQSPGVWPEYAEANSVEMVDTYTCIRLMVPYDVTTEKRKGITRT